MASIGWFVHPLHLPELLDSYHLLFPGPGTQHRFDGRSMPSQPAETHNFGLAVDAGRAVTRPRPKLGKGTELLFHTQRSRKMRTADLDSCSRVSARKAGMALSVEQ